MIVVIFENDFHEALFGDVQRIEVHTKVCAWVDSTVEGKVFSVTGNSSNWGVMEDLLTIERISRIMALKSLAQYRIERLLHIWQP